MRLGVCGGLLLVLVRGVLLLLPLLGLRGLVTHDAPPAVEVSCATAGCLATLSRSRHSRPGSAGAGVARSSAFAGLAPAEDLHQAPDRVVELVHHALLERNDRVVGDRDVLGAHL